MRSTLLRTGLAVTAAAALFAVVPTGSAATAVRHPSVGHVFVIVLENEDYAASYEHNPHPWLGHLLQQQGTLLTQYYATGHVSLDNYVAMMSGQAPNPATSSDCEDYVDFQPAPAVFDPRGNGQAIGAGCVYPANVPSLADQLTKTHVSWHGYMEDMGNDPSREPARCGQPGNPAVPGTQDDTQSASKNDQYAARHNPFVYFHSLLDSGACKRNVVPLTALPHDLGSVRTTPRFSFITPNLCNDGHDGPCANGQPGSLTSVDQFLSVWIPRIERSPAFRRDGLIVITTDEAAPTDDASSCCGEQPGPTDPMPGVHGPGGGRVGALLIGKCVGSGRQVNTPYNHYSLLRTLEDVFGVTTGGTDGKGHLGFAGASDVHAFGNDVFSRCPGVTKG